jgi:hypothetical protein
MCAKFLIVSIRKNTEEHNDKLSMGMDDDCNMLCNWIGQKMHFPFNYRKWNSNVWYDDVKGMDQFPEPSIKVEEAFSSIGDYYIKHQQMFKETDFVEEVSSDNEFVGGDEDELEANF